ncbi:MAG TPA: dihydroxyacetone kinase family protein [Solirubrobacterales bacterium]|nr:dihydroxyacetone kinase family protein [Solirubrobacterales bacterium]
MTFVVGRPERFLGDAIEGFAAAYGRYATKIDGASGFVRSAPPRSGGVGLVVGGGSGHYPSYAGLVGPGLAEACVLGDVFTSPSATQAYRVGRAADQGAGVVLAFGNYAGDRLNFRIAQERLEADGIDARIVFVTDDIASAPPEEIERRRGIAGTFTVYKVGGAAAERGDSLDQVERLMRAANAATFSFGVAFGGCTLPGQSRPLFAVADGWMELGLGIHGEPGVGEAELVGADALAAKLVEAVLAERPPGAGPRAAVLVNGLGATKYEELFVLNAYISRLLEKAGVESILPEVGELVTSLDMAGCSLSVTWLDSELEECWRAPATTAAFHRAAVEEGQQRRSIEGSAGRAKGAPGASSPAVAAPSEASLAAAATVREALAAMLATMVRQEDELGRLDAVAGDGDHGRGMVRGMRAALIAAEPDDRGVGTTLTRAGEAFGDEAGGTSGILWGLILSTVGEELGDQDPVTGRRLAAAVRAAADAVVRIGGAQPGDKTLVDALAPFTERLSGEVEAGSPTAAAWRSAAEAAERAAAETAPWQARVGRARPLGARGVGTPDPGATSLAMLAAAVAPSLARCASDELSPQSEKE